MQSKGPSRDRRSPTKRHTARSGPGREPRVADIPATGPDGLPQVVLVRRGVERWQAGHPWIYRADLASEPELPGGEVVRVVDGRGWFMGKAFYSRASKIALRWLSY